MNSSTALITGASSGIGAEYARQLAAQGYGLILTARREDRLLELAAALRAQYAVPVEVLSADLALETGLAAVEQRIAACETLTLLVNNAGFGGETKFAETDPQLQIAMLRVHIEAAVRLSRAALPAMLAADQGAIINVASVAGFIPLPHNVLYHTTKSYLIHFSRSLQLSVRSSSVRSPSVRSPSVRSPSVRPAGVRVQACCPGFTHTEFHDELAHFNKSRYPKFIWMSAAAVVAESLRALSSNQVVVIPGLGYRLLVFLITNPLTGPIAQFVANRLRI